MKSALALAPNLCWQQCWIAKACCEVPRWLFEQHNTDAGRHREDIK
jgi:hypothetical protein